MKKKKMQKLNKAAVATVLAASGVTVTAPVLPTKASTHFKDLNPNADYYQPVLELANRGYISGYQDGTFRPNQAITRGQAAKMLALALNLNITNQRNPGFRDVPADHNFYKYIAALANEGIINGYEDKTFRPNEPINRNQMAKIIALGYKFQISSKLTHSFADVAESSANRYFIQTLYDLGITKGTTGITYSPFGSVTRGQLATFIVRAENTSAEKVKPIKEIGEVVGTDVYINGIKYRVDTSLRDIINDTNAAALKGAHIEGQIVGETLKTISSLTINAQGTANRMLTFDGNNSTFSGELKVQGNYILFKNWHLTGLVTIAETPRRTLSDLANIRIASLTGLGFIDWNKPTDTTEQDDDPTYNGGGNDLTDKPAIDTGGKAVDRMPVIDKYVDFSNCSLQRLVIEANRTYVATTKKLPNVTIQGWVRQFEIYANIGTLYIEPDVKTAMFGVGDIDTIYKNSFKDVFLNSDSHVKLLVVDNSSGWIDLGDHFYVDKVIIPPNKMPNDIFNDFINDNDNIGDIEDPSGNDVERDPIENTIIPDMEAPTAQITKINVQGSTMTAGIKSSEDGEYYYTIRKADDRIPTIREIIEEAETTTLKTSGTGWLDADLEKTITASGLDENAEYVLYLVTKDEADNYSDKVSKSFTTMDGTPPRITGLTAKALPGGTRAEFTFTPNEDGGYAYYVRKFDPMNPELSAEEVYERLGTRGLTIENTIVSIVHKDLTPQTEYEVVVVMKDESGNYSEMAKALFTTTDPDFDRPYIVGPLFVVDPMSEPTTKVRIEFSEEIDSETAQNVKNYKLGGTGNLKNHPYNAKVLADGKTVELEIPSMASFVHNDTLIIDVKEITDLAGNIMSPQTVTYTHSSQTTQPTLTNLKVNKVQKPATQLVDYYNFTFETDSLGTFYHLIVPYDPTGVIKPPTNSEVIFYQEYKKNNPTATIIGEGQIDTFNKGTASPTGQPSFIEGSNQVLNIPVSIDEDGPLDKHPNGYILYVVLQDRNGNFSGPNPYSQWFIQDENAPKITDSQFVGTTGSASTIIEESNFVPKELDSNLKELFSYGTKETTADTGIYDGNKYFQYRIEFSETMDETIAENLSNYSLNGTAANKMKIVNTVLLEDRKTVVLTLEALKLGNEDYEYNLVHNDQLIIEFNKLTDASGNQVGAPDSIEFRYKDVIKPKLKSNVAILTNKDKSIKVDKPTTNWIDDIYKLENSEITLDVTFTEAIDASSLSTSSLKVTSGTNALTVNKVEKKVGNPNTIRVTVGARDYNDEEELRIDFSGGSSKVKDITGNEVSIPTNLINGKEHYEALYIFRALPLSFYGVGLNDPRKVQSGSIYKYSSQVLDVSLSLRYKYDDIKIYYAIANMSELTPDEIVNAQNYPYSNIYGVESANDMGIGTALQFKLDGDKKEFQEDQRIFIILRDSYGNESIVLKAVIPRPIVNSTGAINGSSN